MPEGEFSHFGSDKRTHVNVAQKLALDSLLGEDCGHVNAEILVNSGSQSGKA